MNNLITNSRLKAFRACPRLHDLRYVQGIRPLETAEALEFGTAMHTGLEAWWLAHARALADVDCLATAQVAISNAGLDEFAAAKASVLMAGYSLRWAPVMDGFDVLAVEREFRAPLVTTAGKRARGLRLAGKIDVIVRKREDGTTWLVEHKTSGADLSPGSTYWQRLRMDSQVSLYFDGGAACKLGEIAGCIYDVIEKPGIRPLKATHVEARKFTKDGRLYANQRDADETVEEYTLRLVDLVTADPEAYFQRSEVIRLDGELDAARSDVAATVELMKAATRTGISPRNVDNCHAYGRPCDYLDVCNGSASIDDDTKFQKVAWVHSELTA